NRKKNKAGKEHHVGRRRNTVDGHQDKKYRESHEKIHKANNSFRKRYDESRKVYFFHHLLRGDDRVARLSQHKGKVCPGRHARDSKYRVRNTASIYLNCPSEDDGKDEERRSRLKKRPGQTEKGLRVPYPKIAIGKNQEQVPIIQQFFQVQRKASLAGVDYYPGFRGHRISLSGEVYSLLIKKLNVRLILQNELLRDDYELPCVTPHA